MTVGENVSSETQNTLLTFIVTQTLLTYRREKRCEEINSRDPELRMTAFSTFTSFQGESLFMH